VNPNNHSSPCGEQLAWLEQTRAAQMRVVIVDTRIAGLRAVRRRDAILHSGGCCSSIRRANRPGRSARKHEITAKPELRLV